VIFAAFAVAILLFIAVKAFKTPTLFYASDESIEQLASKLSCPKCRSRRLRPTGSYTLGCENCGFSFSIGTVSKRPTSSA
jgi:ribosomal protein L37AE/L43A